MSSTEVDMLMDMGFTKTKAEKALSVTGNKGVEAAMEWLLSNSNSDEADLKTEDENSAEGTANESAQNDEQAMSLKCDVCGKLFRTNTEVEFHASKSGHDKFSESTEEVKPLTEEEKKQQLKLLEDKLRQKRKERTEREQAEELEKEKIRIKSGKEMVEAKKRLEELEMKKILEQRKREKEEDRLARQRVKEQIAADKLARKQASEGNVQKPVAVPTTPVVQAPPKNYNETKLQIRLTNGQALIQNFSCKEQLSAVRLYIEMHRTDGDAPFSMMTNFPKKVFSDADYDTPLDVLGLVPSAVIIIQKK